MKKRVVWINVFSLLLAFGLMVSSANRISATVDEQSHLFRGAAYLKTGATHFLLGHPLLSSSISALPLLTEPELQLPLDDPSWEAGNWSLAGDAFLWRVNESPLRLLFLGRLPVIWLTLLLGALVFRWARQSAGAVAGVAAMGILLFDPNVLAHGRIISGDLPLTFFFTLTIYAFWRWVNGDLGFNGRSLGYLLLAGAAFGLAGASKFNAALLVPILALLGGYAALRMRFWRPLIALLIIGAVGWGVIWAVYGFQFWHGFLPGGAFWDDLFWELQYFGKPHGAYLAGEVSPDGWRYYFPVAFALKTPLPTLALLAAAIGVWGFAFVRRERVALNGRFGIFFLLLPTAVYIAASVSSSLNIGYRYLLPMLPFLYIFGAATLAEWKKPLAYLPIAAALLLGGLSLWLWPHYISYFNLLIGDDGWRMLSDSNVDWGQGLPSLAAWLEENGGGERVKLSYFGTAHPSAYGLDVEPLPSWSPAPEQGNPAYQPYDPIAPAPGLYAIGVTNLHGVVLDGDVDTYAYFREREPLAQLRGGIYIYRVAADLPPVNMVYLGARPADLPSDWREEWSSNDVAIRWLQTPSAFVWPQDEAWLVADTAVALGALRPFWPDPIRMDGELALYEIETTAAPIFGGETAVFGGLLQLSGYQLQDSGEGAMALLTSWEALDDVSPSLKLFVHALDAEGNIAGQWDGLDAMGLQTGDRFVQLHQFGVETAVDRLLVGVYDGETGERLGEPVALWSAP